jgi:SAM-dependent methyltransferase
MLRDKHSREQFPEIEVSAGVFKPTGTSLALVEAVLGWGVLDANVLDLGCGSGATGLTVARRERIETPLFASDLSKEACECARRNAATLGIPADVRHGALFEPWAGMTFDIILDDVSAMGEDLARVSSWFDGVPCLSGRDGTELINEVIRRAPEYLSQDGVLFAPVLTLSNVEHILEVAASTFSSVELVMSREWVLPSEMLREKELLRELRSEGLITLEEKFGILTWWTHIYALHND